MSRWWETFSPRPLLTLATTGAQENRSLSAVSLLFLSETFRDSSWAEAEAEAKTEAEAELSSDASVHASHLSLLHL